MIKQLWSLNILAYSEQDVDQLIRSSLVESEICAKLSPNITIKQLEYSYLNRLGRAAKGSSFKIVKKAMQDTVLLIWLVNIYKIRRIFQ